MKFVKYSQIKEPVKISKKFKTWIYSTRFIDDTHSLFSVKMHVFGFFVFLNFYLEKRDLPGNLLFYRFPPKGCLVGCS